jgi:DNA-directed RNA polymerase specialized sigma subunit
MKYIDFCALPTELTTDKNFKAKARLELFNHYLSHKVNSERTVLENIIISFNKKYRPERYSIIPNENPKIIDDSLEDIRSTAHLIVWEATEKYLWDTNSKTNFQHREKFDFCVFASNQLKFKLKTHLRLLNTNRICGKLPDSDSTRSVYSKIPKFKLSKKFLSENDYKSISKETDIEISEVKLIDTFVNTKTESGDEEINNHENDKDNENKWGLTPDIKVNIEAEVNKDLNIEKFKKIKNRFLKTLPPREKEILNCTKLSELDDNEELSLSKLGKKYNISSERVRQISEKRFAELKKILIKNKKDFELK